MWNKLVDIFSPEIKEDSLTSDHAIAAVLVRAARTDNEYTLSEKNLIDHLLSIQLGLDLEEAKILRRKAEELENKINDNVQLTRVIKKDISYEDRQEIVEQLWRIVLDDNTRTPEENKFMRVLTHLLGINDVNSARARLKILNQKK